jgi:branched-chain amino acid aminotransferase
MPATPFTGLPVGDGHVGPMTKALLGGWNKLAGFDIAESARGKMEE